MTVSKVKKSKSVSCSVMSNYLQLWPVAQSTRLPCPWNSPSKNTGVGSRSLLQGIFPTQGLNLGLPFIYSFLKFSNDLQRYIILLSYFIGKEIEATSE